MKNILLLFLLYFANCFQVIAQTHYTKHNLYIGRCNTDFQDWDSRNSNWKNWLNHISYTYRINKHWGIQTSFHGITHMVKSTAKYIVIYPQGIYIQRHVFDRKLRCLDISFLYALEIKKHSIFFRLGGSFRKDFHIDRFSEPYFWVLSSESVLTQSLGYCASLAYQFRVYRNFGVSADVVLRQSKDIPTTLSYGVGLTYSIFNKKRTKNEGN